LDLRLSIPKRSDFLAQEPSLLLQAFPFVTTHVEVAMYRVQLPYKTDHGLHVR